MPGVDSGLREPPAWKQSWCQTVLFTPAFWEAELFLKHTCACSQKPLLLPPSSSFLFQHPGCSGTFGCPALDGPGKAAHFSASPWCRPRSFSKARRLWMRIQTKPKHLEILPSLTPNTFDMLKHVLYSVRNQMIILLFQIIRSILLDD